MDKLLWQSVNVPIWAVGLGIVLILVLFFLVARKGKSGPVGDAASQQKLGELNERVNSKDQEISRLNSELQRLQRYEQEATQYKANLEAAKQRFQEQETRFQLELKSMESRVKEFTQEVSKAAILHLSEDQKKRLEQLEAGEKIAFEERKKRLGTELDPIRKSFEEYAKGVKELQDARLKEDKAFSEKLEQIAHQSQKFAEHSNNLASALKDNRVRGQWGELTLRRVFELAGLVDGVTFSEQVSTEGENGKRPDVVVNLPEDRLLVIDSKVPLDAYLRAHAATSESERHSELVAHAKAIRNHIKALRTRAYHQDFARSAPFTVLFVPTDAIYFAAAEVDHDLVEFSIKEGILIATPSTLIGLLKTVEMGWKRVKLAVESEQIRKLGEDLIDRLGVFADHFEKVGKNLKTASESYDKMVSSYNSRIEPVGRKITELGISMKKSIGPVEESAAPVRIPTQSNLLPQSQQEP